MPPSTSRPVVVLAFANDRGDAARYLRNLPEEQRRVRKALAPAVRAGLCEVVERSATTLQDLFDIFQDPVYRDRIAIFHFGGHAGSNRVLLEDAQGRRSDAHAGGLAGLMASQLGLELVFLNGCSSQGQVEGLLEAGVSAVIATNRAIDDAVATLFSERFYTAVASGAALSTAYDEATSAARTQGGDAPAAFYRDLEEEAPDLLTDRWPWELHVGEGAEATRGWSLPAAAGDPLFGLPEVLVRDLPPEPFRYLRWYTRAEAEVFFGRGARIRSLFQALTAPDTAPIVLFFGPTGAGKSSLLEAGLLPRLERVREVRYVRRDGTKGLSGALTSAFGVEVGEDLKGAWRRAEQGSEAEVVEDEGERLSALMARFKAFAEEDEAALSPLVEAVEEVVVKRRRTSPATEHDEDRRALVVIVDQVEEFFTRPIADDPDELKHFLETLSEIFASPVSRPRGKLVLSFRKEWLAEIRGDIVAHKLPFVGVELRHLDRDEIIEVVKGPASTERLGRAYNLTLEPGLAEIIADDLLEDWGAAIAPTLQILLTRLWERATRGGDPPHFTVSLYQEMKKEGLLLIHFVGQQLDALEAQNPALVRSGLALGILARHTTPLGTAEVQPREQLKDLYRHRKRDLPGLLQSLEDLYLLTSGTHHTRLAHDTLAPIVRHFYESSDRPGQRAERILSQRAMDWKDGATGPTLDDEDLTTVIEGGYGMCAWSPDEQRLVDASRKRREQKQNTNLTMKIVATITIVAFMIVGVLAIYNGETAEREMELSNLRGLISQVQIMDNEGQHKLAALGAIEALRFERTIQAGMADDAHQTLRNIASSSLGAVPLNPRDQLTFEAVAFHPDGRQFATSMSGTIGIRAVDGAGAPLLGRSSLIANGTGAGLAFDDAGEQLISLGPQGFIKALRPQKIISLGPNTDSKWDPGKSEAVTLLTAQIEGGDLGEVTLSPDTNQVAYTQKGTLWVWRWRVKGQTPVKIAESIETDHLKFGPKGRWLGLSSGTSVRFFDLQRPEMPPVVATLRDPIVDWHLCADRSAVLATQSAVSHLKIKTDGVEESLLINVRERISALALDPGCEHLALGHDNTNISLRDLSTPRATPVWFRGHQAEIYRMFMSRGGSALVSVDQIGQTRFWQLKHRLEEPRIMGGEHPEDKPLFAAFRSRHHLMVVYPDSQVVTWDVRKATQRRHKLNGEASSPLSAAMSPDGKHLALVMTRPDQTRVIAVVDAKRPQEIKASIEIKDDLVEAMVFVGPHTLAFGDDRGAVKIWDTTQLPSTARTWAQGHSVLTLTYDREGGQLISQHDKSQFHTGPTTGASNEREFYSGTDFIDTKVVYDWASASNGVGLMALPEGNIFKMNLQEDYTTGSFELTRGKDEITTMAFGRKGGLAVIAFATEPAMLVTRSGGKVTRAPSRLSLWELPQRLETTDDTGKLEWKALRKEGLSPIELKGLSESDEIQFLAFSLDGVWLAAVLQDGRVAVWIADTDVLAETMCGHVGRNLTKDEWKNLFPEPLGLKRLFGESFDYRKTCPQFP